jgi:multidrug efflux pump subunit AcrA (membrane-fusion protein)
MRLERPERGSVLEVHTEELSGNGWRRRLGLEKRGPVALKLVALALLAAAGAWAYVSNFGPGARPAMNMDMRVTSGATPFPVTLARVERGPVRGTVVYTGSVAPFNEEDIYPRVTGRIVEMPVYPGDAVRAGQLVARLDDVELASRVREAEAMAATSQAGRAQMEADLVAAQHAIVQMERELAMVEAELGYARAVAARSERLVNSGAISRQEYENDRAMATALEAKGQAARAKLDQARAMEVSARKKLDAADAMVAQGRAALRTATVVRDYVNIVSPSSGFVVKRLVAPGVLVQLGMPILKIAQIDRVRLQANVGEKDLASIRVGSPVAVRLAGVGRAPMTARVTSVFPFVDQGPRTAVVEAVVENVARRFLPGQYVQMEFVTGERAEALTVPRGAVSRLGGTARVWVVRDGRAEPREVTTGLENPARIEIANGLQGDERVVARGHEGLYAGARVAITGDHPAPAAPPKAGDHEGMTMPAEPPAKKEGGHAGH